MNRLVVVLNFKRVVVLNSSGIKLAIKRERRRDDGNEEKEEEERVCVCEKREMKGRREHKRERI